VRQLWKDLASFTFRGNMVDLAIGIVIGTAFTAAVNAFVRDLLTPLISIPGKVNFAQLHATVGHSVFAYGDFLNFLLTLALDAVAVFFLVARPIARAAARRHRTEEATTRPCPECLSDIPKAARRCAQCTAVVEPLPT
jgi:large conductance mechanosensitive channel